MTESLPPGPDQVLDPLLQRLRVSSMVGGLALLRAPWGLRQEAGPDPSFHLVLAGSGAFRLLGETDWTDFEAGDFLWFTRGAGHELRSAGPVPRIHDLEDLLAPLPEAHQRRFEFGGQGAGTDLLCAGFRIGFPAWAHVLEPLPEVLHLGRDARQADPALDALLQLVAKEGRRVEGQASAVLVALLDALVLHLLRDRLRHADLPQPSWIRGALDPVLSPFFAAMHRRPERAWSLETMARQCHLSRSAFAARFRDRVGDSPARYLNRWRIRLAQEQLLDPANSQKEVAQGLGFGSVAVFQRSFRRLVGMTPDAYRRKHG